MPMENSVTHVGEVGMERTKTFELLHSNESDEIHDPTTYFDPKYPSDIFISHNRASSSSRSYVIRLN